MNLSEVLKALEVARETGLLVLDHISEPNIFDEHIVPFLKDPPQNLKSISLTESSIGLEGALAFVEMLRWNTSLESLVLRNTEMGAEGIYHILCALEWNQTLRSLDLRANRESAENEEKDVHNFLTSSSEEREVLRKIFEKNKTLTELYLQWNGLGDELIEIFGPLLQQNKTTLSKLGIDTQLLTKANLEKLSTALSDNTTLRELEMTDLDRKQGVAKVNAMMQMFSSYLKKNTHLTKIENLPIIEGDVSSQIQETLERNRDLALTKTARMAIGRVFAKHPREQELKSTLPKIMQLMNWKTPEEKQQKEHGLEKTRVKEKPTKDLIISLNEYWDSLEDPDNLSLSAISQITRKIQNFFKNASQEGIVFDRKAMEAALNKEIITFKERFKDESEDKQAFIKKMADAVQKEYLREIDEYNRSGEDRVLACIRRLSQMLQEDCEPREIQRELNERMIRIRAHSETYPSAWKGESMEIKQALATFQQKWSSDLGKALASDLAKKLELINRSAKIKVSESSTAASQQQALTEIFLRESEQKRADNIKTEEAELKKVMHISSQSTPAKQTEIEKAELAVVEALRQAEEAQRKLQAAQEILAKLKNAKRIPPPPPPPR